jgi:beta-glucosidase
VRAFGHRRYQSLTALATVLALTALSTTAAVAAPTGTSPQPRSDAALPPAQRATLLVAQMTLDEKIAEVHGAGFPTPLNAAGYAGVVPANTRLGIPALYLGDSPVGVGNGSTGVTQWADTSALASTWDPALARAFGQAYGAEQAGKGHNIALAPTINILRTPLWGRAPETYSEDPFLTGTLATADIRGIQSDNVIATAKHFVANNQEYLRSSINVVASQRTLHEIYQPAFKMAVQQGGVGAIMCSYNRINGTYACENGQELTDTLRDAWRFDGLVMSDWGALHSTIPAARAGLDLEMPGKADDAVPGPFDPFFPSYFNSKLKAAVLDGSVPIATLDTMVTHILTAMFRIGLFDHRLPDPSAVKDNVVSTPAHLDLSTTIAEEGTVLLKNTGSVLPLRKNALKSIAVIGDAAYEHPQTAAGGSATVLPSKPVVSPLAGVRAQVGPGTQVNYSRGTLGPGALPAVPASAFGTGLHVTYYSSTDLTGTPVATGTVANLDYTGNPAPVASLPTWSARYTGTLTAPASGDYRFTLNAGAYVTVWIDGRQVVRYLPMQQSTSNGIAYGLVHLTAGAHSIRVDVTPFTQQLVGVDLFAVSAGLHLGWQPQENVMIREAVAAARTSQVAVVVVSDPATEGADRPSLALPADQDRLISAVAAVNPRTIVVLNTASAVTMPWLDRVAAVFEAWYPGQTDGTATSDVLFGKANPSGKLPVTFPRSNAQGPDQTPAEYPGVDGNVYYDESLLVGYRWYNATGQKPLFPFGYGLSYTSFRFSHLTVRRGDGGVQATVTVTNTGSRAGAEIAELYLTFPRSTHEPPQQLKAFARTQLRPGQSQRVTLTVSRDQLAIYKNVDSGWTVEPGSYGIAVGDTSASPQLSTTIRVS